MLAAKKSWISSQGCWWSSHAVTTSKSTVRNKKKISIRELKSAKNTSKSVKISLTNEICKFKPKIQEKQLVKSPTSAQIKKNTPNANNFQYKKDFKNYPTVSSQYLYQQKSKPIYENPQIKIHRVYHPIYQNFVKPFNPSTHVNHRPTSSFYLPRTITQPEQPKYHQSQYLFRTQSSQTPMYGYESLDSPICKTDLHTTAHTSPLTSYPKQEQNRSPEKEQIDMNDDHLKQIERMLFSKKNKEQNIASLTNSLCQIKIKKDTHKKGQKLLQVKQFAPKMAESDYGQGQSDIDSDQFSDVLQQLHPQTPLGIVSPLQVQFGEENENQNVSFSFYSKQWLKNF